MDSPRVEFALLADRAEAVNGKLYVLGGAWDRITVQDFSQPVVISFAVSIIVPWNACNEEHTLSVKLLDDDGQPAGAEVEGAFNAGRPPSLARGEEQRVLIAVPAMPVQLPRAGGYLVLVGIDGAEQMRVRFRATPPGQVVAQGTPPS